MKNDGQKKIPLRRALGWIFFSSLAISGSLALGMLYFQHVKSNHANNSAFNIVAIIQTTNHHEPLQTAYFAELLDLSTDKPTNLYKFNTKEAKRKLLASPLIKRVDIKKVRPATLYIDYDMRVPIAFLSDYSNVAIDREGRTFPFSPFFTPKVLPEIYLAVGSGEEGGERQRMALALECLDYLSQYCCLGNTTVQRLDVSQAFALSYGQRQIVVALEDVVVRKVKGREVLYRYPRILRLFPDNYKQGLANYLVLRDYLLLEEPILAEASDVVKGAPIFIDLRLPSLGYVSITGDLEVHASNNFGK